MTDRTFRNTAALFASTLVLVGLCWSGALAQTGKITGTVTDAANGDPLPGVNVVLEGTTIGATTNADGVYSIINVPPGTYTVRASFVGYATAVVEGVNVNIDLTTGIDIEMQEQTQELDEVTVQAQEEVVKRDISANVQNISAADMENVANVSSLEEMVGLTAGVQGLNVRGSDISQLNLNVDGLTMRNGRTQAPFMGISYTSIDEVQVQTGGFNAEYGNVRSGLINVVTKEGPRDRYSVDVLTEYRPPGKKYFGPTPDDPDSYWMRPYLDDPDIPNDRDPALVGTHTEASAWDRYTRRQYPRYDGYDNTTVDYEGQSADLTFEQFQEVFNWYHRKDFLPGTPDYTVDGSIGGPVPLVSDALGDLRFMASYRQNQTAYMVPMERNAYRERTGRLKLTSNITPGMKLALHGMYGHQSGHLPGGNFGSIVTGGLVNPWGCCQENQLFANNKASVTDIYHTMGGVEFTHTLSSNTFYKASVQRNSSEYDTYPGPQRDTETVLNTVGSVELTESPFGWNGPYLTFLEFTTGAHEYALQYDSSYVATWTGSFDITSQIDQYNQVKAGLDIIYNNQEMNFEHFSSFISSQIERYDWNEQPIQGAVYLQDKLEFEGMITNVGVRLDYFDPNTSWYQYDPFSRALSAAQGGKPELDQNLEQGPVDANVAISPRLGVSFPITTSSKLFFNYGHFRQMLDPADLFRIDSDRSGGVTRMGNPRHPMPLTVSYELGYEQRFLGNYLLRMTGYYKALENQPRGVDYTNIDNTVTYEISRPANYGDIRGAEVTVDKVGGQWFRGFANFTFMSEKGGNFGFGQQYENSRAQREYERQTLENLQFQPVARPYARLNLRFLTPQDYGPSVGQLNPLGNWTFSLLGNWQKGYALTWTNNANLRGVENNLRWRDDWNLDLRVTKDVQTTLGEVKVFMDVSNLTNYKNVWNGSFQGENDYEYYMRSLHLSEDAFAEAEDGAPYLYIPGDDKPGDYRDPDAEFTPIEVVNELPAEGYERTMGKPGPLYYVHEEGQYYSWNGDSYETADEGFVDQVLEDKAYIDMPNLKSFRFLNPRDVRFGLRVTF